MDESTRKPGTFQPGDIRINRKGRPRSFDALRKLAQQIAHEEAKDNGKPVVVNGHVATVAEIIMRSWAFSKNPPLTQAFIEIAFGKTPNKVDVTSGGKAIVVNWRMIEGESAIDDNNT